MTNAEYFTSELTKVGAWDESGDFKVKVVSSDGQTRWLSLTPDQFHAVAMLLTSDEFHQEG